MQPDRGIGRRAGAGDPAGTGGAGGPAGAEASGRASPGGPGGPGGAGSGGPAGAGRPETSGRSGGRSHPRSPGGGPRPSANRPGARRAPGDTPAQPGWHGWAGNPDELWPPFGDVSRPAGHSRTDRREQQIHDLFQDAKRRPPQRQRLSREEIVDAAIAIADTEGADALSMRRIAQVLRAGTMSLYWHVSSKERLLDLMRDTLMSEVEVPEPSGNWRSDLRTFAISSRGMLRRHLWLMDFVGGRPPLGPTTMLVMDRALAILESTNAGPETGLQILEAVNTYVSGAVLREAQEVRAHEAEHEAEAEAGGEDLASRLRWRDRLAETGLFPRFVEFLDLGIDPDAPETRDSRFEFGLDCLLDGVAARLPA
jgi:AcrR family transcriptional regulator